MSEEMIITPTITRDDLRNQVEQLVYKDKMTYAEAICEVCESLSIDPEDIVRIVTGPLRIKLEAEAMQRNIIKNTTSTLF